ncbi:MAG: sulfotransferase family protein, partial [Acidimicrobiales bacterium]
IPFDRFMDDGDATLADVYRLAGQPLDDVAQRSMARFQKAHPRGRHGAVVYDPGPLGLPTTTRPDVLEAYRRRFLTCR